MSGSYCLSYLAQELLLCAAGRKPNSRSMEKSRISGFPVLPIAQLENGQDMQPGFWRLRRVLRLA